jgi:hypothetical protein
MKQMKLKKRLIIKWVCYATYLDSKGLGPPILECIKLKDVMDGKHKKIYGIVNQLTNVRGLRYKYLIIVSTYKPSTMTRHENGFASFKKKHTPNLNTGQFEAHREYLAIVNSSNKKLKLLHVKKNKKQSVITSWKFIKER